MSEPDLLVIGAGAKAAAVAAKVHILNSLQPHTLSVRIVESTEPAASWLGRNGMTSGEEPLAISPIKDVGYPYESGSAFDRLGPAIDRAALAFSWQSYLVHAGGYASWINAGLPAVQHREYGRYLRWVLEHATCGVELVEGRVSRISMNETEDLWRVRVDAPHSSEHQSAALMVTGPGLHRAFAHHPAVADRLLHCDSERSALAGLPDSDLDVAIVGGGESALSALTYLKKLRPEVRCTVYTATLPMTRGESSLENRVFADPDEVQWERLDLATRRDFIRHCDRGVFDARSIAAVASDPHCRFVTGRAIGAFPVSDGGGVCLRYRSPASEGTAERRHDYIVNCTGFDMLAYLRRLLSPVAQSQIERQVGSLWDAAPGEEVAIDRSLSLRGLTPRLHVPGLAALSQGPGFANLGCLGLLSNRVLEPLMNGTRRFADALEPAPQALVR